jgi:signal transduction histidine kinase
MTRHHPTRTTRTSSQPALLGGWLIAAVTGALAWSSWRALTALTDSVAHACHELRGPITAARLGLHLGDRAGELSSASLRAIDLELGRASLALDDLTYSRTVRGASTAVEQVDVAALLTDSVLAWQPAAAEHGVELTARWTGCAAYVIGERTRLAQATGNLIANAIEHGEGPVVVEGQADRGLARIEVRDRGVGLPASVIELSTRRINRTRSHRGRGLGIAAAIADAHGGRLASRPSDCGARLVLELPVSCSAGPSAG